MRQNSCRLINVYAHNFISSCRRWRRSHRRRLNVSSHAKVRSPRARKAWMASLPNRIHPRFVRLRFRGFSVILGIMPAWKMRVRLCAESKPPSRVREALLRSNPTLWATFFKAYRLSGHRTLSVSLPGATGRGASTEPLLSVMAMIFFPLCSPREAFVER